MLVVPIGHKNAVIQRHAWVTYSIIALNVVMFVLFCTGGDVGIPQLQESWRFTIGYLRARPYLSVPVMAEDLMPPALRHREPVPDPAVSEWQVSVEQREVNGMAAELRKQYDEVGELRLAYIPAVGSFPTLFTSMFLHAGIFHLLGNMFFLFATGTFLEDVFGRPLYIALYLIGGVIATASFGARYPDSIIPLVGASGAIAAVMGAYLVRFTTSSMQFMVLPFTRLRFSIPALVFLPLWFLQQLVSIPMEAGANVAVTAHVAGFAFGLLLALGLKLARIEEKFIQPNIEKQISWQADGRLDSALAAFHRQDYEAARRDVTPLLAAQPGNIDVLRLALDIALSRRDMASIDSLGLKLLSRYAADDRAAASELIEELCGTGYALPQFLSRAAGLAERNGDRPAAIRLYEQVATLESGTANAIPALMKLAVAKRSGGDVFGARETLSKALSHPACSPEWRRKIDSTLELM